jgi:hypothetical protein
MDFIRTLCNIFNFCSIIFYKFHITIRYYEFLIFKKMEHVLASKWAAPVRLGKLRRAGRSARHGDGYRIMQADVLSIMEPNVDVHAMLADAWNQFNLRTKRPRLSGGH